ARERRPESVEIARLRIGQDRRGGAGHDQVRQSADAAADLEDVSMHVRPELGKYPGVQPWSLGEDLERPPAHRERATLAATRRHRHIGVRRRTPYFRMQ